MTFGFKTLINGVVVDLDTLLVTKAAANAVLGGVTVTWGDNNSGSNGDNSVIPRSSPVAIGPGNDQRWFTTIDRNNNTGAGIKNDGSLWMWGWNAYGQLGINNIIDRSSPVQVGTSSWIAVATDGVSSFAIRSDGTLWSWGDNGYGQNGNGIGATVGRSSPGQIGTSSWIAVSAGSNGVLAIRIDGTLWAWGGNERGMLGLNDTIYRSSPTQVGTSSWASIGGIGFWSTSAIRADGRLFVWGYNSSGELGQNDTIHRSSPVQVGTNSWVQASSGYLSKSAVRSDGTLWVWGDNGDGRLGIGDTFPRSSPVQVGTETNWYTAVNDDSGNLIALKTNGTAWNSGNRTPTNNGQYYSSPVQIATSRYWRAIDSQVLIS